MIVREVCRFPCLNDLLSKKLQNFIKSPYVLPASIRAYFERFGQLLNVVRGREETRDKREERELGVLIRRRSVRGKKSASGAPLGS
jgi:hypothetical protein